MWGRVNIVGHAIRLPSKAIERENCPLCSFFEGVQAIWFKLVRKTLLFFSDFDIYSDGIFLTIVAFSIFILKSSKVLAVFLKIGTSPCI